jgi:hypothetical protein
MRKNPLLAMSIGALAPGRRRLHRPARILEPQAAAGYQVIFVPFKDGNPQDALTDFLNDKGEAQGRREACASTRAANSWRPATSAMRSGASAWRRIRRRNK